MSEFVIHGVAGSPYVRSVLLTLEEKRVPWRLEAVAFGGHYSPAYERIHPFRKMPACYHGDFHLYETQAILRYVDRIGGSLPLTPANPRRAARMDQFLNIADAYLVTRLSGPITFARVVAPRFELPIDEEGIAAALPGAAHVLGEIVRLQEDNSYLTGEDPTLADLHVFAQLSFLPAYAEGRQLLAPHASLARWIERMEARPSAAATTWERVNEAPQTAAHAESRQNAAA